jgi:rfaE bifunctional protein nucleotidyltransferase chain/domain
MAAMSSKMLTKRQLQIKVKSLRKKGKTIVTTNGVFDLLHAGHAYLFTFAHRYGDILIVGINSDLSVKKIKGSNRPIIGERFRAMLLTALAEISYVYIFNEPNPIEFLKIVRPDVHVNSSEYGKNCIESSTVRKFGGKLILAKRKNRFPSTSKIIYKIKSL